MISDDALREAAFAVDQAMLEALPDTEEYTHTYSPAFEKKMCRLVRRANHPVFYKTMYRAACVLLVLMLSAGLVLTFHTEARATVVEWIKENVENYFLFTSSGEKEDTAVSEGYCIGWIPDGYTLLFSALSGDNKMEGYVNDAGQVLVFQYIYRTSNSSLLLGGGEYEEKYIVTDKLEATVRLSKNSNDSSNIVWYAGNGEILLHVSGYLEEGDLIKIAESVYLQK